MRKFYLAFPICATVSHKLSWSHYIELLKCDDPMEMQFYMNDAFVNQTQPKPSASTAAAYFLPTGSDLPEGASVT